ncbi:MAG: BrnT family toxin [Phycisphaeraceae bacterium]|nr:BrnT family toxin [Phycisphaeraceae bacterium]
MTLVSARYVWDPTKARTNRKKHGISFQEAVTSFADPLGIIVEDGVHPERAILIGVSWKERILLTVFIAKSGDEIRLISARLATRAERRSDEEGDQEDEASAQASRALEGVAEGDAGGGLRKGARTPQSLRGSHREGEHNGSGRSWSSSQAFRGRRHFASFGSFSR